MIKKLSYLFACIIFAFCCTHCSAEFSCSIPEVDIELDLPSDYYIMTRDVTDNTPGLSVFGYSAEDMRRYMEEKSIYLCMFSENLSTEITMTEEDTTTTSFDKMDEEMLDYCVKILSESLEYSGFTVTEKNHCVANSGVKYVCIVYNGYVDSVYANCIQYSTIVDGRSFYYTLFSYNSECVSEDAKEQMKNLVFSARYSVSEKSELEAAETYIYSDPSSGAQLSFPGGWSQAELLTDTDTISARFEYRNSSACCVLFGSTDIERYLPRKTIGKPRDITFLTEDYIREWVDSDIEDISTVTLNGVKYYKIKTAKNVDIIGYGYDLRVTRLLSYKDGRLYSFQFSGDEDSPLYQDFISVVENCEYPAREFSSTLIAEIVIIAIGGVVLICAVVLLVRRGLKKRKNKISGAVSDTDFADDTERSPNNTVYCHKCGRPLGTDWSACAYCGTAILEETKSRLQNGASDSEASVVSPKKHGDKSCRKTNEKDDFPEEQADENKGERRKKRVKTLGIIALVLAVALSFDYYVIPTVKLQASSVGSSVFFGRSGLIKVEWIVLDEKDGDILVISKYAVAKQCYYEAPGVSAWSSSSVRAWLNDDFYNSTFSKLEKSRIVAVVNPAERGCGGNAKDNVFLLSVNEVNRYMPDDSLRCCKTKELKNVSWWLRSPGIESLRAAYVNASGEVISNGGYGGDASNYCRPAIWIHV